MMVGPTKRKPRCFRSFDEVPGQFGFRGDVGGRLAGGLEHLTVGEAPEVCRRSCRVRPGRPGRRLRW